MTRRRPGRPRKRGAPKGNTNALKHGRYTAAAKRAHSRRQRKLKRLYASIKWFLAGQKKARAKGVTEKDPEFWKNK